MFKIICSLAITFLLCLSLQAQNSLSFQTGITNNPDGLVDNEAYLNMEGNLTTVEYTNPPISQFNFGYSLNKSGSNWSWDFGLSYYYIEVNSTVHHDSADRYGFSVYQPWQEGYIASLNYFGISGATSFAVPFKKNGHSKLQIPIGAKLLLPFSCKTLQDVGNDTYLFKRIFQGKDYSKGIYYGLYLRPTYSFQLSKNQNSSWIFGIFAEAELLFLNQANSDPNLLVGGGIEIRYLLN